MKRNAKTLAAAAIGLGFVTPAFATNGDNLIGIGPISRALGGTGVAAPQDAISAVFANPAAMCISPSCATPQADIALTLFMPEVNAGVMSATNGNFFGDSKDSVYAIPALGVSMPIGEAASRWRAGFSAYGVSGLGVDYARTPLGQSTWFGPGGPPLVAGFYTDLAILKLAPSVAYAISPEWSIGVSGHIDYATLDLGLGAKNAYGFGGQLGLIWKPTTDLTFGFSYVSPQATKHDNVLDFDQNGILDSLKLEAPQQVALGVAWTGLDGRLLIELNGKWLNWEDADGYKDFGWEDEWVVGIGAQYELVPEKFWLRAGYNFGTNPVEENNGFNGSFVGGGDPPVNVQGKMIPRYYYETFRTIGFPAIVQHHLSVGCGWQITPDLVLNFAYLHAFEETFSESGIGPDGGPVTLRSDLSEDSVDLSLTWRF
jgi:long-chain fatty acid transport protein